MNLYVVTDKEAQQRIWITAEDVRGAFDVIEDLIAEGSDLPNFKPDVTEFIDKVYSA